MDELNELLEIAETLCDENRSSVCGCEEYWLFDYDKAPDFDYEKDCCFQQLKKRLEKENY